VIREGPEDVSMWVAQYILKCITEAAPTASKPYVMMLSTGTSVTRVYKLLGDLVKQKKLSFRHVITFNTDEYVDLPENHPHSYHTRMYKDLFQYIDIDPINVNFLNGNASDLETECKAYEQRIAKVGGIDLFVSGTGEEGQVAMNEPGSSSSGKTHWQYISRSTRLRKAEQWGVPIDRVPKAGLSVGWATIMSSKEVLTVVFGQHKASALNKCIEQGINHMFPLSSLQDHVGACVVADVDATSELRTRTVQYFKGIEKVSLICERDIDVFALPAKL